MSWRDRFEVPGPGPYLLAHSVGSLPRAARGRLDEALFRPWATLGSDGWPDWLAAVDGFLEALAPLIGAAAAEICPQPSVSAALTAFLSGLPRVAGRDRLVASTHSFPSIGYAMAAFERFGLTLDLIDGPPGDPATWEAAIDDRTAAVVAMHVHSNSGIVAPVAAICARARAVGAASVIDVCQSIGILDVDLRGWGADAAIGSCVKWLCGGPGAAFLAVRAALIPTIEPLGVGWFSHADPFAFDISDFRYACDARRFWGGTPSVAPFVLATAGIETIAGIGPAAIRDHNRALAAATGFDLAGRGGTLCLVGDDPDGIAAALGAIGARVDRRGDTIRLSFAAWNTIEEATAVGAAIRRFGGRLA